MRPFRYLDALTTAFVVILLVSNVVAQTIVRVGPFSTSGTIILSPITYIATAYLLKVGYEILATPLPYLVVNFLKRAENSDAYDARTNFNPFRLASN